MSAPNVVRDDAWVVSFHETGTKPPLFCPCPGNGDVFEYRDFAEALPSDQPIYAFGLPPNEQGIEVPTVERLAAIYVRKVRQLQKRGPYQLCGYSFGGLVVYEMAVQLMEQGDEVGILALIDTRHPRYSQNLPTRHKVEFHFIYFCNRIAKYARNMFNLRIGTIVSDVFRLGYHRTRTLVWRGFRAVRGKRGRWISNSLRDSTIVLKLAWNRYAPRRYHGPLLLLKAFERPPEYARDQTLGWEVCATGAIAVHNVPGDHYAIMHPPQVRTLVGQLMPYLVPTATILNQTRKG